MTKLVAALALAAFALAAPARARTHNVSLAWTASTDAAANPSLTYNVYRSPGCSGAFTKLNASPVTALTYTDTGLLAGTYCYQATSVLAGTESAPSNQAVAIVPAATSPATPPAPAPPQSACTHRGPIIGWIRCVASRPKKQ